MLNVVVNGTAVLQGCASECDYSHDSQAPRGGLNSHQGFVELGSFAITKLRQTRTIDFYAWTRPPELEKPKSKPKKKRDPLRLARYYQSLLATGKFESRAALVRHLGVSRARVTQVLNRLKNVNKGDIRSAR